MERSSVVRRALIAFALVFAFAALPSMALAEDGDDSQRASKRDKLAFFDSRQTPSARITLRNRARSIAETEGVAIKSLRESLGSEGIVAIDPLTRTPRMVGRLDDFLTAPSSRPAESIARDYVSRNASAFGLKPADIAGMSLERDYVSDDGTHHLFFVQKVNGVPVFGNGLKANVTNDGRLVNVLGSPVTSPSAASAQPRLTAAAAVVSARSDASEGILPVKSLDGSDIRRTTTFSNGDKASLVFFQGVGGLRLAWQTYVSGPQVMYLHVIDSTTGRVLYRRSLVNFADALVYDNYPGAAKGGTQVQTSISRTGWLTAPDTLTGNNTHVYTDVDDSNDATNVSGITEEIPPTGGNWLYPLTPFTFGDPLDGIYGCTTFVCSYDPRFPDGAFSFEANQRQSGTQLFYLINKYHDHLAARPISFTEAAGNFQQVNASGKGLGGDPVLGEALDGADTLCCAPGTVGLPDPNHSNNANMATPPDGFSPRMQMYLWHDPLTDLTLGPEADPFLPSDGSNEADIVFHEYTHGLSNRLVVDAFGNSTLGNIQAGAMGEAWSDWYAFDFLVNDGFVSDTAAPGEIRLGAYVGKNQDLIRSQPMDCPVGTSSPACPGTPGAGPGGYTYGDYGKIASGPEVHADGEIWAATLWDLRGVIGVRSSERLITRAMELAPANPSFLDMRNSILQANLIASRDDDRRPRGDDKDNDLRDKIWLVFKNRGMGYFAAATDGDDAQPVEDFSMPPGRRARTGDLNGKVTDIDTNVPLKGAVVAFGGHASGFPGDFAGVANRRGNYEIERIFFGTYHKVSARAPGYDRVVTTVTINNRRNNADFKLRRDWAALSGGASISDFNGPDYTPFGCGPSGAIDQSQGNGWGSDTDDGTSTGFVTEKFIVVQLPVAVDITEIQVDPSNTCGDPGSSSTRGYRIEGSADGETFSQISEGVFYAGNRAKFNKVELSGPLTGVRYVKFWILNPQVPNDPALDAACTNETDCGSLPDNVEDGGDANGVAVHCGPAGDNGYGGCTFMDMSELVVYGKAS